MLGVFKRPKKNSIYTSIERTRELARKWAHAVAFRYVLRDVNTVADDMVRRARDQGRDITFHPANLPADAPPISTGTVYTFMGANHAAPPPPPC